jgi:hypothetical protein
MLSIDIETKSGERDAIRADNVESRDLTRGWWQMTATPYYGRERMPSIIHHSFPRDISCSTAHFDLDLILLHLLLQS